MMQRYQSRSPGSMQQRNHKASEVKRGKAFSLELLSPVPDSAAAESTSNVCLDNLHRHKSVKHGSSTNYEVHQPCTYSDVYVSAEILVEGSRLEHMVGGGEQGGGYGSDSFFGAAAAAQAEVLSMEVAVLGACGRPGALH